MEFQAFHILVASMFCNFIVLDIPIIDIHNEVFKTHPDPLSLFPFRIPGHYNAEGYRLVAEAIGKQLDAGHYISIN